MVTCKRLCVRTALLRFSAVSCLGLALPGQALLWSPADITTALWFDAAQSGSVTLDGNNGVSLWSDQSGNGRDVLQNSADRRPTYDASGWSNGLPELQFDTYNLAAPTRKDTLGRNVNADNITGSAFTLFLVVNAQSLDNEEWPHNANISTANGNKENRHQINANGVKVRSDGNNGGSTSAGYVAGEQILQFTLDTTISEVRRNGAQVATNSGTFVGGTLINDFTVNGRNSNDGHAGMTGDMAEFIYLAYNPDQATRERIEGYLAWKWGLQGSLDVAHPYKNAAPTNGDPADLDGDGDVDDADFGIAFAAFTGPNNGPSNNPAADLDGDGDVDDADFGIAFAAFTGPGGQAGVVPEPASLALTGLGGLCLLRRRRG